MLVLVAAVSTALVVSFLCSIFESVLLTLRPAQVEALATGGRRAGRLLRDFKERIDLPIAAILIVNTIAHTIGATVAGASYVDVFGEGSLWLFSVVFTIAVLLLTEIIPKTLGVTFAERLAVPVAHAIHWLTVALRPLVVVSEAISRGLRGSAESATTTVEEIRLLTAIARSEKVVGGRTAGIITGATRLGDLRAVDVMVPRTEVRVIPGDLDAAGLIRFIRSPAYSRFPFSPTGRLEDTTGVVLSKELMFDLLERPGQAPDWDAILRKPLFVPETVPLNKLLWQFISVRRHLAVVVDEYGDTLGIVTLEDVIEEIVGDIFDESDPNVEEMRPQDDGSVNALARVDLRKLCDFLELQWHPADDFSTLGGLVTTALGRVPVKGDVVTWRQFRLEVLRAGKTRPDLINVSPIGSSHRESGSD